ncbi:MAG: gp53-like domain-containing protein [Plesiomonas sp.]
MSLIYPNRYPGRWDPTSAQYPQGKFKNRSSPTAKDGSFCEMDWANDWAGFFGAILKNAGITPNGSVDTATASQLYDALIGGIVKPAGLRDVGTGQNQIPDMSSFVFSESGNSAQWKLPSGIIEQTYIVDVTLTTSSQGVYEGSLTVPFIFPFPSKVLCCSCTNTDTTGTMMESAWIGTPTLSRVSVYAATTQGSVGAKVQCYLRIVGK